MENLDPMTRKALLKTFRNQGWRIPADLSGEEPVTDELTLRKAMELCLRYPEMRDSPTRERIEQCFEHLTDHFGSEFPGETDLDSPDQGISGCTH